MSWKVNIPLNSNKCIYLEYGNECGSYRRHSRSSKFLGKINYCEKDKCPYKEEENAK